MTEILKQFKDGRGNSWFFILACGHWFHWTGRKRVIDSNEFDCPNCRPPIGVVHPDAGK